MTLISELNQIRVYCSFWIPRESFLEKFLFVWRASGKGKSSAACKVSLFCREGEALLSRRGWSDLSQRSRSANYQLTFTDFLILGAPTWCRQPDKHRQLLPRMRSSHVLLFPKDWQLWAFQPNPEDLHGPLSGWLKAGSTRANSTD